MTYKRLTILCGHYGSGKTNIAVNMAFDLKKQYDQVALADLDIVNPYFRSADSKPHLEQKGIRLIASDYVNTNVDVPALPQDMYTLCDDRKSHAVIDLGGDERGALALGRLREKILSENDYEMLFVLNCYRVLTQTPEDALEVLKEIEQASGIAVTGILNNSNLGRETTVKTVLDSTEFACRFSEISGIPLVATFVAQDIFHQMPPMSVELLPLNLQKSPTG